MTLKTAIAPGWAIAKVTALEVISEPLALLMGITAQLLATLAPAFHYHQFGEPTRMARDAGISAIIIGGTLIAVFGAIKTFRRDIELGTAAVCLSHGIGRRTFFLAKTAGVAMAYGMFFATTAAVSLTVTNGAAIGGYAAAQSGALARLWGPSLAIAISPVLIALIGGALLNRFLRCRFVRSANLLALAAAAAGIAYRFDGALYLGHLADLALAGLPALAYLAAASAFAAKFRMNAAGALAALTVAVQLPFLRGWAVAPAVLLFLYLGEVFFDECDIA